MPKPEGTRRDIVVIGASAGGVDALKALTSALPRDFGAAVFIVLHVWSQGLSLLPRILDRVSDLPAAHPRDGDPIEVGRFYVAPPDHHLVLEPGVVRIVRGPKENRHRPAVDPLFRSAATIYGERVIGCVLTGTGDDGTAGALSIKRHGGVLIAQDPAEAPYASMPRSVIENAEVDYVLPVSEIAAKLIELVQSRRAAPAFHPVPRELDKIEVEMAEVDMNAIQGDVRKGKPSSFACPECNGALWEIDESGLLRFRCRVGHAFTADSLSAQQSERLENALWKALLALEEAAALNRLLAERARSRGNMEAAVVHERAANEQQQSARTIRSVIVRPDSGLEYPGSEQEG
jgi:two-component system chemotaxis response regulator CheB